jgi:D-alanyl-lipoteichoic acid acyltransferase DltB (MBOAT superfamily)
LILHPLLRRGYQFVFRSGLYTNPSNGTQSGRLTQGLPAQAASDARLQHRISFDAFFAVPFIIALHGVSFVKILLILYMNYRLAKDLPKKYLVAATWTFNIGILFANELGRGYHFAALARTLGFGEGENWGARLDKHGGLISRWEVLFNITILRLISFNMDYYWSLGNGTVDPVEVGSQAVSWHANDQKKKQLDPADLSERDRVSISAKPDDYSFKNYLAYTLYAPLYLAGPILTFNDYISQLRHKPATITIERTTLYAIRFLMVLLTMELMMHFIYAVAIAQSKPDWATYSPFQLSMLGYFNLHHIWLKLLIPWRFFRLWALVDDIDPPENMGRCMSNNYSALAFWRGWHRSFNRWIVRYMFVPLGGSGRSGAWAKARSILNYVLVFLFVAIWHDINLRLLMWGWLVTFFLLPEALATLLFPAKKWRDRPDAYRWICGVGAIGNILMMMIANLVGYALGIDGLKGLLEGIFGSTAGVALLAAVCGCLFIGTQVMFELREEEKRTGIKLKF